MRLLFAVVFSLLLSSGLFAAEPEPVNINRANAQQLADGLVGVGKTKAEAIIVYREAYGEFASVDELASVKGIGPAIIAKNRDHIVLK